MEVYTPAERKAANARFSKANRLELLICEACIAYDWQRGALAGSGALAAFDEALKALTLAEKIAALESAELRISHASRIAREHLARNLAVSRRSREQPHRWYPKNCYAYPQAAGEFALSATRRALAEARTQAAPKPKPKPKR